MNLRYRRERPKAGARFISISENVAQSASAKVAHSEFMHSPSHKATSSIAMWTRSCWRGRTRWEPILVVQDFSKSKK